MPTYYIAKLVIEAMDAYGEHDIKVIKSSLNNESLDFNKTVGLYSYDYYISEPLKQYLVQNTKNRIELDIIGKHYPSYDWMQLMSIHFRRLCFTLSYVSESGSYGSGTKFVSEKINEEYDEYSENEIILNETPIIVDENIHNFMLKYNLNRELLHTYFKKLNMEITYI